MSEAEDDNDGGGRVYVLNRFQREARAALGGEGREGETQARSAGPPIVAHSEEWQEEDIRSRQWLVPGYYMRGTVTLIAGKPSAGKSLLSIGHAVAAALGRPWGRFRPAGPLKVGMYCIEDDEEEVKKRLSAALSHHGATPRDLEGRLTRFYPSADPVLLRPGIDESGAFKIIESPAWLALREQLTTPAGRLDLLFIDPMAEAHSANENENGAMSAVMGKFRGLSRAHALGLGLIHHTRKGSDEEAGNAEISRGASSIIAASRQIVTCAPMTAAEAERVGLNPRVRHSFTRVDAAKSNYAGLSANEDWYEKVPYILRNPDAEEVVALVPWQKPAAISLDQAKLLDLVAHIGHGIRGTPYSPKLCEEGRSIRRLFQKFGISRQDEKSTLRQIHEMGVTVEEFVGGGRHPVKGYRTKDNQPAAPWLDGATAVMPEPLEEPASMSAESALIEGESALIAAPEPFEWGF